MEDGKSRGADREYSEVCPGFGNGSTAIAKAAVGAAKREKLDLRETTYSGEAAKKCLDRRREKGTVARKSLSIALCRARQVMRRKQADLHFKTATEVGAPSRLNGSPTPTRKSSAQTANRTESGTCGDAQIVHDHSKEVFTDPMRLETLE